MKLTFFLCLLTIVFSCKQNEVLIPNSTEAPDLNFSKAQWVNEYQYDGVFTLNRFYTTSLFTAYFTFYGAEAKAFNPDKDLVKIDGGFLMNQNSPGFLGFPLTYYSGIVGKALIDEMPFDADNRFYFKLDNTATANIYKYNPDLGITWRVTDITIPDTPQMKSKHNLYPKDVPSFLISKGGIKLFPDTIKLASGYTIPKGTNDLTVNLGLIKNADLIYYQINSNSIYSSNGNSGAFLKYLKGDATSITITRNEIEKYVNKNLDIALLTVIALKFYTTQQGERKFLFKNISVRQASIKLL